MTPNHFSIEALEPRIAPAGVFVDASTLKVTLASGVLKIAPLHPGEPLDLTIEQQPDGDFLISDTSGDDDLEETPNFTGVIRSIAVAGTAGDDSVHLALLGPTGFRGSVSIATGAGLDTVHFSEGLLRGALTTSSTGELDFSLGGDGAPVDVKGAVIAKQIGGEFLLTEDAHVGSVNAVGATYFDLSGAVTGKTTLTAKTAATFEIGSPETMPTALFGNAVRITGSAESDVVHVSQALVRGAFVASLGDGDNEFTAGSGTTVYGIAQVLAKNGNDTVTIGAVGATGPKFLGKLTVKLGGATGANAFSAASGLFTGGVLYQGTDGADHVEIGADVDAFGSLVIAAGKGANTASIASFSSLTAFSYAGGVDSDAVMLGGLGAGYVTAKVALGDGADSLTVAPAADSDFYVALTADGGAGTDILSVPTAVSAADSGFKSLNFEA